MSRDSTSDSLQSHISDHCSSIYEIPMVIFSARSLLEIWVVGVTVLIDVWLAVGMTIVGKGVLSDGEVIVLVDVGNSKAEIC